MTEREIYIHTLERWIEQAERDAGTMRKLEKHHRLNAEIMEAKAVKYKSDLEKALESRDG